MGEERRDRARLGAKRWVLIVAMLAAAIVGGLGGARAAAVRDHHPGAPAERAQLAAVRGADESSDPVVPAPAPAPSTTVAAARVSATTVAPIPPVVTVAPVAPVPPVVTVAPVGPVEPIAMAAPVKPVITPAPAPEPVVAVDDGTFGGWVRRTDLEAELFAHHNAARAGEGLAPYSGSSCLTSVAVRWARTMAERSMLAHNPRYADQIMACSTPALVGENVGVGYADVGGVARVFDEFMASPTHRINVMDPEFNRMGIGVWSHDDGTIRIAVNFAIQ